MNTNVCGTVYLVGAGPGDPGLLTLRGAELLARAGAVVHDALANPLLLERAPPGAERFNVGKRGGRRNIRQGNIDRLLVRLARRHEHVVRLKGGDPFVFGRGGEEAMALRRAGVRFEIVPGVTSAVGALAYAGIPLTHRGVSSSVSFVTGHRARGRPGGEDDPAAATPVDTLVVFMGLKRADEFARELIRQGRPAETPVAVVDRGTLPDQRVVEGTLGDIGRRVQVAGLQGPALIVVGEVVRLRSALRWFREEDGAAGAHGPAAESGSGTGKPPYTWPPPAGHSGPALQLGPGPEPGFEPSLVPAWFERPVLRFSGGEDTPQQRSQSAARRSRPE